MTDEAVPSAPEDIIRGGICIAFDMASVGVLINVDTDLASHRGLEAACADAGTALVADFVISEVRSRFLKLLSTAGSG